MGMGEAAARKRTHVLVHEDAAIITRIDHLLPAGQREANHAMELIRLIRSDIRIVIGRLDEHGLHGVAQRAELILQPDAITIASDDVLEPVNVTKGARRTRSTIIVRFALCLYHIEHQRHACPLGLM